MAKRIVVWTETAAKQRREILKYWTSKTGSTKYAGKLIKISKGRIKIISNNPLAFKLTSYDETRVSSMGHFSIFYKVSEDKIIITAFWDTRQDPKKVLEIVNKQNAVK
jgi:plasmid stabilization system protein ParE